MKAKSIASSICFGLGIFVFIVSFLVFICAYPTILQFAIDGFNEGAITDTAEPSIGQALITLSILLMLDLLNMASIGFFVTACLMICPIIFGDIEKRICAIILASFSLLFILAHIITLFFF